MLKLKKIAVTGGIASGKSTVCQFFQELGAYVVNADALVHELFCDPNLGQQVLKLFGPQILREGKIDRRILAEEVFSKNPSQIEALEALLHPAVLKKIEDLYHEANQEQAHTLFVVEIPLLYEIHQEDAYDVVIAVVSDEALAKKRFEQAGFTQDEYEKRMKRQWRAEEKAKRADYIIRNNGSLAALRQEAIKIWERLL